MEPPCQQFGRRYVKAEIAQREIGTVTVADVDPVDFKIEWDRPVQSRDRNGKVRSAYRALEGPREPSLPGLRLEQTKRHEDHNNQQTQRGAEPAKYSCRSLHQKACPRLI